jgi:hypothetical protein
MERMSVDSLRAAREARSRMLEVRPADAVAPLPDDPNALEPACSHYFEQAALLYAKAAEAFQLGDTTTGLVYELWAYQYLQIGQACVDREP